jgi:uncharacterized membrane protein YeaQ/YmgE (transglycosylase-associated protein family)
MFTLIWMLFIGLIVGALARLVTPGRNPGGIGVTILLGIGGSLIAGLVGRLLGLYGPGQRAGFVMSTLGAVLLLALYRMIKRKQTSVESTTVEPPRRRAAQQAVE